MEPMEYKGPTGKLIIAIQISLGALVLLVALAITYYCSTRVRARALVVQQQANNIPRRPTAGDSISGAGAGSTAGDQDSSSAAGSGGGGTNAMIEIGLDEAALRSFPKLVYSGNSGGKDDDEESSEAGLCCSICLADFEESEVLRLLPDCGHVFHQACVDPWLRLRPTCPNCRTSPIPTPITTPLAEVTPLAWT